MDVHGRGDYEDKSSADIGVTPIKEWFGKEEFVQPLIQSFEKKLNKATADIKVNGHTFKWSSKGHYQGRWGKPPKGKKK